jgi:hypothetical protein
MLVDGCVELKGLEKIVCAVTRKHGEPIGRRLKLILQIQGDPASVALKARTFRRIFWKRLDSAGKFLSDESVEIVTSMLSRLSIQIKTDEREPVRFVRGQFL